MNVIVVGLSHKTAPVEIRERLAFSEPSLEEALRRIRELPGIRESLIISTCNRVEIYANSVDSAQGPPQLKKFLSEYHQVPLEQIQDFLYNYTEQEAIHHLFRVACSLDSMVVGEPQILGQVKKAYQDALDYRATGGILNKLFPRAFSVAKRVRTETGIANHAVSVSFAAVELTKKIFESLEEKVVMLVGAGEMAELAARHLKNSGIREVFVTSRTYQRAEKMAEEFQGTPLPFDKFFNFLDKADIVICSAAAPHYLIRPDRMEKVMKARKNQPMFFIDISVPRNIDPKINDIANVYLYDIDDLEKVVEANIKERQKEAIKAEEIIRAEAKQFYHWLENLEVVPVIKSLKEKVEGIRKKELEKSISQLKGLSPEQIETLEALTSSIINKILHDPITQLKKQECEEDDSLYLEAARKLFNLD
ncbi:MAG: glutamyl-tRNA reductase [Deltaproteobacteria bacterium]|nr:MAG: glutamyl-tRNA reductase [Deltaproteobacteria bacterium]